MNVFESDRIPDASLRLGRRIARIAGDESEEAVLAVTLALSAVTNGSILVDLGEPERALAPTEDQENPLNWPDPRDWEVALASSPLTKGEAAPLHLSDSQVFLQRYWNAEGRIAQSLADRNRLPQQLTPPTRVNEYGGDSELDDEQLRAIEVAVSGGLTIITGGPGTGKTYTVAKMLVALHDQNPDAPPTVALAAPTGKAAARMKEAIAGALANETNETNETNERDGSPEIDRAASGSVDLHGMNLEATTLHGLLKPTPGNFGRFRRNRTHPLPHDVVIVDEASMISVSLLDGLLQAVRPDARLILVGDENQLASVEAGTALADIVASQDTTDSRESQGSESLHVVRLIENHRNQGRIPDLAKAIRNGEAGKVVHLLKDPEAKDLHWVEDNSKPPPIVVEWLEEWQRELRKQANAGNVEKSLRALNELRVLCAHRQGPAGVARWAPLVRERFGPDSAQWPIGQPMMITRNGVVPGLYNGDTGVVIKVNGDTRVAFSDKIVVSPDRLGSETSAAYALTTHKSQGSEFDRVVVVLPESGSRILTRELLYTAVTRARNEVAILGTRESLEAALQRRVTRATGLSDRLRTVGQPRP
jgi:exodeoxyribonuclease V alpha subunit